MYRLIAAAARLALALISMMILLAVLFGVPILFVCAIFAAYGAVTGTVIAWNIPILVGIGIVIFFCLVVADAYH